MYDHETRKRIEVALKRAKEAKRNPPKQYRAQAWRKIGDIIVADSKKQIKKYCLTPNKRRLDYLQKAKQ